MHYRKLDLWLKSIELTMTVYSSTAYFPKGELYGLSSQMRRAAVSIPSNVAEGQGRSSDRDNRRFVLQARGSLYELETQLFLAAKLGYLNSDDEVALTKQIEKVGQLLNGLLRSLNRKMLQPNRYWKTPRDGKRPTIAE
jgi:four helix bundle protein